MSRFRNMQTGPSPGIAVWVATRVTDYSLVESIVLGCRITAKTRLMLLALQPGNQVFNKLNRLSGEFGENASAGRLRWRFPCLN
ncbi:MAG: hypothetical protein JWR68_2607 [Polaromonas sp.]|nr:hypothetical protein [Polaromonas sp.]